MKTKKVFAALLSLVMVLSLAACGSPSNNSPSGTNSTGGSSNEDDTSSGPEKLVVQIAYENNPGEPIDDAAQEWKRLIEERSDGSIEVQLFPSSQLGSKTDLMDQMLMGEPIVHITDGSFLADYGAPEMAVISAPYVFSEWDQCWKLLDTGWWGEQEALLEKAGLHIITANWMFGERNIMTVRFVRALKDMSGLIMRTPSTPSYMKAFELMGAAPTAMAAGDIYTALQQGSIDGLENVFSFLYGQSYYEVAGYVTLTRHVKMPSQWVCSQVWWEGLTEEQQTIISEAGDEAGLINNEIQNSSLESYMEIMEEKGVEIIDLTDAERARFADAASGLYSDPSITAGWRDGLLDYIQDLVK